MLLFDKIFQKYKGSIFRFGEEFDIDKLGVDVLLHEFRLEIFEKVCVILKKYIYAEIERNGCKI